MADKGRIKQGIKGLQGVKTWQLLVLLIIFAFIAATFLRLNNIGMVQRREAVINADKEGDATSVTQRLYNLQQYVSGRMNTDLGRGVYLESTYNKELQSWQEKQYGDSNPNGNIYKKAQEVCAPQFDSWSMAYIRCTTNELEKYPSAEEIESDTSKPRQEMFIHDFESPRWSPDFAGWSLVVCAVIALLIVIRLLSLVVLQLMLKRQYRRV